MLLIVYISPGRILGVVEVSAMMILSTQNSWILRPCTREMDKDDMPTNRINLIRDVKEF